MYIIIKKSIAYNLFESVGYVMFVPKFILIMLSNLKNISWLILTYNLVTFKSASLSIIYVYFFICLQIILANISIIRF